MKAWRYLILILVLSCFLTACSLGKRDKSVTIASKQFTENILLGEMYAQLIEHYTDLQVSRKQGMGNTIICFTAIENGEIDMYVEYTGTIYKELLGYEHEPDINSDELYGLIKKQMNDIKEITVFQTIGLNNTFTVAMSKVKADAMGIETMSDLARYAPRLVFAANNIYFTRINDGYNTMAEKYGLSFKSVVQMDSSLLYGAAADDQVDAIVVYATDSQLPKYDMVILEDDKQMFPDYYAVPIIRNDILKAHPELNDVLDFLANSIDNERMQQLNYSVDIEEKSPEEVAGRFLSDLGLLNNR